MSEFNKDLGRENTKNTPGPKNNDFSYEETSNVQNNKDIKESDENTEEELREEIKDNDEKKEDTFCRGRWLHSKGITCKQQRNTKKLYA